MKSLIYAFGEFGGVSKNISEEVLNKLEIDCDKRVLRVRFDPGVYKGIAVGEWEVIIGLGQYPRGKKVRIEQQAQNSYGTRGRGYTKIDLEGPELLAVDYELALGEGSEKTDDAGQYVCNYSMYQILRKKREQTKFAFLHIPKQMELEKAIGVVEKILRKSGVK